MTVKVDIWRLWISAIWMITLPVLAQEDSLEVQRRYYHQIKLAWDAQQMDAVEQLMPALRDYPLFPYLTYRQLLQNISQVSPDQINSFIQDNPTLSLTRLLHTQYINELANRQDWYGLLVFSPQPPKQIAARCNFYYAKWATGKLQEAWDGAHDIWLNGNYLPDSCNKLFVVWNQAGARSPLVTLERIHLAMRDGNTGLVNYLLKQLPYEYRTMGNALAILQDNPATLLDFIHRVNPTDLTRQATQIAFDRLVSTNVENARSLIPIVAQAQQMRDKERLKLEESVAWRLMSTDTNPEQASWRDKVILRSHSTMLLERRIRMSLRQGDMQDVRIWLNQLSDKDQQKDEWCYWRGRLLIDSGQYAQGELLLRSLMKARGFYPIAAAEALGENYIINVVQAAAPDQALAQEPAIARVRELLYWNMDNLACSEWNALVASRSRLQQEQLARYAFLQQWPNLSVQATITGKLWDYLEERFPLAWHKVFHQATNNKGISQSYAMAIARQESAWNPKVRSPVGAAGLMQLMPRTAQHTARMFNIAKYTQSSQLLDPQINIAIGTAYLEYVYQMFNCNRILASIAYNAGPNRVNSWLNTSAGRTDAIAFIESIPFLETRVYVKNVLVYDMFYRYFLHQPARLLTDIEWQQRY